MPETTDEWGQSDPDPPGEYLTEIGRVTTRWAMLESILDLCLMRLAGKEITDPRSLIIFNHMAFPMKLDILGAFAVALLPTYPRLYGYSDVIQALKQAQEKRNMIAHSKWGRDEKQQVVIARFTARGKLKSSVTPISVAEIRAAADMIENAAKSLYLLVVRTGEPKNPPQTGQ